MKYRCVVFIIINFQIQKLMRFTFFAAAVAACNLLTNSQASSLIQNEMQLFEEPATIFTQVDEQPMPKKTVAPKVGPKKLKPNQVDEGTAGKAKKGETEGPKTAPKEVAPKETGPKKSGPAGPAKPTAPKATPAKPAKKEEAPKEPVKK